MNKKIFLTSAVIMCMACPAIAETFPQDGNMLENKTYDNAATYTNTGVYEGDVTADAEYSLNPYSVAAGSYFTGIDNNNDATTSTCTSGNYCPGVASTTFDNNAFGDTGLRACPANYSGSATGATANTDCYRACSTTDVAKSATVSGQMYYDGTSGDGVNACEPLTCVSGWHVKPGISQAQSDLAELDNTNSSYIHPSSIANNGFSVGLSDGLNSNDHNSFRVDYRGIGALYGHGRCSTQSGSKGLMVDGKFPDVTTFATLTDETGQEGAIYCYCQIDSYTPAGGISQKASSPWVFIQEFSSSDYSSVGCASGCSDMCANNGLSYVDSYSLAFRATIIEKISGPVSCEANTINITWNDASAEDIAATGAATTVYEGDIKTPLKAVTKPGKTFVGWKFIKPTNPAPVQGEGD